MSRSDRPDPATLRVDADQRHLLVHHKWRLVRRHRRWYWQARDGRYLHRLIAGATRPDERVIFKDNDTMNCRRKNLLITTPSEVAARRRLPCPESGYRGVQKNGRWWRARVWKDGERIHIGNFRQPEAAARAYDATVVELWGAQALTNERLGFLPRLRHSSSGTTGR